jgi:phage FluMu gp28-like protein
MFARQTGKTYGTCGEIVDDCLQAEIGGKRTRWVILSRGERQAKEAMDECIKPITKAFYALYKGQLKSKAEPVFYESEYKIAEAAYRSLEVAFPSGSRITALPANPDTARGFSANVFLDEFAFHDDSRKIWKALFPVISKPGLKLRITSTPNGKSNKFYELWTAKDTTWSRHKADIYEVVEQGLDRNIEELRAACGDEDLWRQEFELEFLDEATAWLTYDDIVACEHELAGKPELYGGGPCYLGNDIARRKDLWVLWVWENVGDVRWCRDIIVRKNIPFSEQDAIVAEAMQRYKVVRLAMDQTGMGEKPVEDAKARYGKMTVEGVLMSAARELTLATTAKQLFEDRKVRIPKGDPVLRADLHKLQKISGATGAPRILSNRDSEGHADRAWACFLGAAASDLGDQIYEYTSVKSLDLGKYRNFSEPYYDDDFVKRNGGPNFGPGAW